jgi:hypothetical protein
MHFAHHSIESVVPRHNQVPIAQHPAVIDCLLYMKQKLAAFGR